MFDRDIEEHWQVVKESYPDAVVFHECSGVFVVRGTDVAILSKEFSVQSSSRWLGFDEDQAWAYMSELAERGYGVVRATNDGTSFVQPPADRRGEIQRQRKQGKYLAVEPRLLFEEQEVEHATNEKWLDRHAYRGLLDAFEQWLRDSNTRTLKGYGEVYIYQVADWYEVDAELTSMLEGHVLLLAKAAFATGLKLPCRLVAPKSRRERRANRRPALSSPVAEQPRLGQLGFADLNTNWLKLRRFSGVLTKVVQLGLR